MVFHESISRIALAAVISVFGFTDRFNRGVLLKDAISNRGLLARNTQLLYSLSCVNV